jgi:hypothetical protein
MKNIQQNKIKKQETAGETQSADEEIRPFEIRLQRMK